MDTIPLLKSTHLIPRICDDHTHTGWTDRLAIDDLYIQSYAIVQIVENRPACVPGIVKPAQQAAVHCPFVRAPVLTWFLETGRFDEAEKILALEHDDDTQSRLPNKTLLAAVKSGDVQAEIHAREERFLQTGDLDDLRRCAHAAADDLRFEIAWVRHLRLLFMELSPHANRVMKMLRLLERADRKEAFQRFGELVTALQGCDIPLAYWRTMCLRWADKHSEALDFLEASKLLERNTSIQGLFNKCAAEICDSSGQYKRAAAMFAKQNENLRESRHAPRGLITSIEERKKLEIPILPADHREDYFIMTGFPRSGTTLLENALSTHPSITTAEETSSFTAPYQTFFTGLHGKHHQPSSQKLREAALSHRNSYYLSLDRHLDSSKPCKIDKTPILSAHINYMSKLFPKKQYIFSLRHPYDVALSNYKQAYSQNASMAAFNQMDSACDLYDYVMSSWFQIFPGETDRVCYVYYDELVTNFEPTIRRVIDFLGAEWDDAVLDFAEHSKKRAVRTPSYANVRKGLSLGVQSSYQNYLFLFDDYCRSKLDPWVEFFGYTVEEPKK